MEKRLQVMVAEQTGAVRLCHVDQRYPMLSLHCDLGLLTSMDWCPYVENGCAKDNMTSSLLHVSPLQPQSQPGGRDGRRQLAGVEHKEQQRAARHAPTAQANRIAIQVWFD